MKRLYSDVMILPNWNSEIQVEITSWYPFGKDYHPVSLNRFYDETLRRISESSMNMGSEFFFMASPLTGCVGNLSRENFFKPNPDSIINLGFIMTFGYSYMIERSIIASFAFLDTSHELQAGITTCSLWSRGIYEGSTRVVVVTSDDTFYDCTDYLKGLAKIFEETNECIKTCDISYYAEKFGYNRFFMEHETDRPTERSISEVLSEMESDIATEITGGSSVEEFPSFLGTGISMRRES